MTTPNDHGNPADHPALGIMLTIVAGFVIAGMDAIGKYLMQDQSFVQVVWGRYTFHTILVFIWLWASGGLDFLRPKKPMLQTVRAAILLAVTLTMYTAFQMVPLADATVVMFFAPVLVTALAGLLLGEPVGWRRYAAVAVGFIGVLVIVQPGVDVIRPGILWACGGALFFALYVLMTRKLQALDKQRTTLFHSTGLGVILLSLVVPFYWQPIPLDVWPLFIGIGAMGAGGHFLLIKAFHLAPAATLSPFLNAQLVAASIYSVVFFGDPLTLSFFAGATLIVGAGLFIWYRERRQNKVATTALDDA